MSTKSHLPPLPPDNCSPHGPAAQGKDGDLSAQAAEANKSGRDRKLAAQGHQGDITQNTTNQGYQQDQ